MGDVAPPPGLHDDGFGMSRWRHRIVAIVAVAIAVSGCGSSDLGVGSARETGGGPVEIDGLVGHSADGSTATAPTTASTAGQSTADAGASSGTPTPSSQPSTDQALVAADDQPAEAPVPSTVQSATGATPSTAPAPTTTPGTSTPTTSTPSTSAPPTTENPTVPETTAAPSCDPNYSGACVPIASAVDCAGGSGNGPAYVQGPVQVIGSDIYGLDRDNDGVGCENG